MLGKHWLTCKDKKTGILCILEPDKKYILELGVGKNTVFFQHINFFRYLDGLLPLIDQYNGYFLHPERCILYALNSAIKHGYIAADEVDTTIIPDPENINIWYSHEDE